MGKYIIELPDDEHLISWWTYTGTEDGKQHIDFHEVVKTPYDLDAIRKEAYAEGYKEGMQLSIDDAKLKKEYQRGINDAWEAARKIACDRPHGGFRIDTKQHIFGASDYAYILANYNASEAIEGIKAYEQEQQIQVGDEVDDGVANLIVLEINEDGTVKGFDDSGSIIHATPRKKTGRHFPEIAKVLKRMQEETA